MNSKADTGSRGEALAADFLERKGYSVLERNYRHKRSEIDLIVRKNELLVFVEVKAKANVSHGHPEIAVDDRKAAKVMEGAEHYIDSIGWKHNIRFDVIAITFSDSAYDIEHFEDAFY